MDEFMQFVNAQRDPRLNEILFPYCNLDKAQELIAKYEQNEVNIKVGRGKKSHEFINGAFFRSAKIQLAIGTCLFSLVVNIAWGVN